MSTINRDIVILSEYILLDKFLKWSGMAETGGQAKLLIHEGQVLVNNETESRRSRKLIAGDIVCIDDMCFRIVEADNE